jgi:exopolyphosphatase/guanosine-5'-triphosphate,3'-diphosphate pyrophosphatase
MAKRFAAADIGSNTAHILVAEVDNGGINRVANVSEWLSLGQVVAKRGSIPPEVEVQLSSILQAYKKLAKQKGAERIYVFATEAVRKARGHAAVIERISAQTGLEIDIITPEREAELALRGAMIDMPTTKPSHFIEVGGGSAQVAYWEKGSITHEASIPIGTGVLAATHGLTFPPEKATARAIINEVKRQTAVLQDFPRCTRLVASGGVARGIWRALHPDGDPIIAIEELDYIQWASSRLNVGQIERRFRVKEKRAATIFTGALVYRTLMDRLQHQAMRVSIFGVREGAVLMMKAGDIAGAEL